ncbi:MAG: polysaccharide biosynthesis tyrosine autokinase [Chlorobiaceae bacterium]|jgi:capsular exopolysaccharide synthesis family protein|nr:polysaccharide biosynthesis tyrosine autokinase [Chlorobiaceae bacterium]NTV17183.1 polysaccharide biosynthesis tyrosine autokinase [Chlorobiaceae bacterium]
MSDKHPHINHQQNHEQSRVHEITLEEILKIIFRRKYGILFVLVIALAAALVFHFSEIPEYRAVSVMMINTPKSQGDLLASVIGATSEVDNKAIKKDVELLKSMPIAELAVAELYDSGLRDSLEFFGKRHYSSPVSSLLEQFNFINPFQKPVQKKSHEEVLRDYAVKFNQRIKVESVRETNVLKVSVASPFPDEATFLSNTLCRVYKEADKTRNSEKYSQASRFIADMLGDQQKKVTEADDAQAKYMESHEIYEFSGNTQKLLDKLIETDAKQNDIAAEYNIAKNNLDFLEKKLTDADKTISTRIAESVNMQLGTIMDEIRRRESEYVRLVRDKGINDAEVKAKRQQLDVVKTRYEQLSRSKIAGEIGYAGRAQKYSFNLISEKLQIERKLNDLNFSSREFIRLKQYYESQLGTLPKKQQDYAKLMRDREVINKTYVFLKEKLDETRILLGSEVGSISLIGSAFRPFKPEKPDLKKSILMGLVLGSLLAGAYTYGVETLDDTIKDEEFFKDIGLTVLSVIPLVMNTGKSLSSGNMQARFNRLLYSKSNIFRKKALDADNAGESTSVGTNVDDAPRPKITDQLSSAFAESFRTLRTALDYSRIESPLKSIIVSGAAMSEGKSTVCANLGMALAIIGKKTLIIDCDLRRASQHKIFNCTRQNGLTDYLFSQHHTIDDVLIKPTHIDNLFVLTAGKKVPNPNELLGSPKMLQLLKELEGRFDRVLIDSPPLFLSDAALLARSVDGILLTARMQYTSRKPLEEFAADPTFRPLTLGVAVIASRKDGYGKYGYGKYGYGNYEEEV